ncbi:hypothetical protein GCM10028807_24060 [Spirosoma daeguense]
MSSKTLTIEQLIKDFNRYTSRKDFFTFWLNDVNERLKRKKIELGSRNGYVATLNSLKAFRLSEQTKIKKKTKAADLSIEPETLQLPFNVLTPKLLENFRAWMKAERGNVPSTVENHMKNLRFFVKRALINGNVFDDLFKVGKIVRPETFPDALTEEQLQRLTALFKDSQPPDTWQAVLRHFLFS